MDIFQWIIQEFAPEAQTSETLLYEHMASQSGRSLPIIYQPFDANVASHWQDRGAALDFVLATRSEGKRVLDFGPGDGWPSLIIAPAVAEVVGVEGARRRVEVCRANARRLGIANASFQYVPPGARLPFPDESFDAVVAASSIEQSPDPHATLAEFYRVLVPGGRARLYYEALGQYRGGREREAWLWSVDATTTKLMLYDRRPDQETVLQIGLTYAMSQADLVAAVGHDGQVSLHRLSAEALGGIHHALVDAGMVRTHHASGVTLRRWLRELGFSHAYGSHSAGYVAGELYRALADGERPETLGAIDDYLHPIAETVVELRAPLDWDPMITAVK